ncbi:hypothetical protein WMY93_020283 [Mugilogobius chulae]|uniref:C1q domain-containing protein n=1 Tax=Mugilogobius chulae TaxID=88201 RepID=A0AAW0NGN4_9GOBI
MDPKETKETRGSRSFRPGTQRRPRSSGPSRTSWTEGGPGANGPKGYAGQRGEKGRPYSPYTQRALFSLKREINNIPENDQAIEFNSPILPDPAPQPQLVSSTNGTFICKTQGVYFFSFHISVRSRVCLKLLKNQDVHMNLCDTSEGYLVTSGSAVLPYRLETAFLYRPHDTTISGLLHRAATPSLASSSTLLYRPLSYWVNQ